MSTATRTEMRPRFISDASGSYIIVPRAVQYKSTPAELGNGRYVADVYRLQHDAGTRAGLLYLATGRASSTVRTCLDYGSDRLRELQRTRAMPTGRE